MITSTVLEPEEELPGEKDTDDGEDQDDTSELLVSTDAGAKDSDGEERVTADLGGDAEDDAAGGKAVFRSLRAS